MRSHINLKLNRVEALLGCPHWRIARVYFWPAVRLPLVWYLESISMGASPPSAKRLEVMRHLRFAVRDFFSNLAVLPRIWRERRAAWLIDNSNTLVLEGGRAIDRSLSPEDDRALSRVVLEIAGTYEKRELSYRAREGNLLRVQRSLVLQFLASKVFSMLGLFRTQSVQVAEALDRDLGAKGRVDPAKIERIFAHAAAAVWSASWTARIWKVLLPKPTRALIVSSYSPTQLAFLQCLQSDGIPVEEIQHGLITAHHPGYTMRDQDYPPETLPAVMRLFGKGWISFVEAEGIVPFEGRKNKVLGVPWISNEVSRSGSSPRVLVTSQEILREDFDDFMESFAAEQSRRRVEIVIRAHPSDGSKRRERFRSLTQRYPGVKLDDPARGVIVSLCDGVTHHLSVFSTCLFEANSLGIVNLVPRVTFSELSKALVDRGAAVFIDPSVDLRALASQVDLGCFEPYRGVFV